MGGAAAAVVHVNHAMRFADGIVCDAQPANDTKPAAVPQYRWIHCANEGTYRGHHQGEFDLTPDVLAAFVRNLRASPQYRAGELDLDGKTYTGGVEPVIQFDYEHVSEMLPVPERGAPAVGWVMDVELRKGADGKLQLWAFADLGIDIRRQISDRQYRWVSIAFTLTGVHWITGEPIGPLLTSIAFTNHPYMQDLEPLAAANRVTSQPARAGLKPEGQSPEAHGEPSSHPTAGGSMSDALRARLCPIFKINLAAADEQVAAVAEEAVKASGDLTSLLESLGVSSAAEGLKIIPALRDARDKLAAYVTEIDKLFQQDVAVDAEIGSADVGAAMRAQKLTGPGAAKAFLAYRNQLIVTETEKLRAANKGVALTLSQLREARDAGRTAFFTENGVKEEHFEGTEKQPKTPLSAHPQLGKSLVATANGGQLEAPKLTIEERNDDGGDGPKIDLRAFKGPNVGQRLLDQQTSADPAFAKLPWAKKLDRVATLRQTAQLILE